MDIKIHESFAIEAFNKTWEFIDKTNRTIDETIEMIHLAHTSRYHWGIAGNALNKARGEWQISHVYSIANMGESALFHAEASYQLCIENNIGDFDLTFAYEAYANAYKVLGKNDLKDQYLMLAHDSLNQIKDEEDRKYTLSQLNRI